MAVLWIDHVEDMDAKEGNAMSLAKVSTISRSAGNPMGENSIR
jgi:hypothetical protein